MNKPRKHHTVAKTYLSGFCGANGKLSIYDREKSEYRSNQDPAQLTTVRDFYGIKKDDGTIDYTLEEFLSTSIEGPFSAACAKLVTGETLSEEEQTALVTFAVFQYFRTTRTVENIAHANSKLTKHVAMQNYSRPEYIRSVYERMEAEGKEVPDMSPEELSDFVASGEFDMVPNHSHTVLQALRLCMDMLPFLLRFPRYILVAPGSASFLTSDHPASLWAPPKNCLMYGSPGFATPGAEFVLPLTSDLSLLLRMDNDGSERTEGEELRFIKLSDPKTVRALNARVVMHCDRVVIGCAEALVRSVVDRTGIAMVPRGPTSDVSLPEERAERRKTR